MVKLKFAIILILGAFFTHFIDQTHTVSQYALVTLPGTIVHELAHYTIALFMDGYPSNFTVIPDGNTLGSVMFVPNSFNAASVGLAPFLLAPFAALLSAFAARSNNPITLIVGGYLGACLWAACVPSGPDFSIAAARPTSWLIAAVLLPTISFIMWLLMKMLLRK